LGCLHIGVFLPMTVVLPWGAEKVEQLLDVVTREFPVPADSADHVRTLLGHSPTPVESPPDWPAYRAGIAAATPA
jgi:hypothetical protein